MKIKLLLVTLTISLLLTACSKRQTVSVARKGELENLIRDGDLGTRASLNDFSRETNIYALGYVTGLKGFITIINSKPYVSYVDSGKIRIDSSFNHEATLLLSSKVTTWKEFPIPKHVETWKQLEGFISNKAEKYDVRTYNVFPFLLKGKATELSYQVIDWDPNMKLITYRRILQEGITGKLLDEPIEAIGFYSKESEEILAHHETSIHVHFLNHDHSISGRMDEIKLDGNMTLFVPVDSL